MTEVRRPKKKRPDSGEGGAHAATTGPAEGIHSAKGAARRRRKR